MPDRIAIFVDGGYLDKILQREFSRAQINYSALSNWMANGIDILRTYYYNCLPFKKDPPTPEQSKQFANAQSFFSKLNSLPKYEVREGKLEFRGVDRDTGRMIFQQKRVDIMLGVDLTILASKHMITHAAIVTGDSDFLPAIVAAKQEGIMVKLFHSIYNPTKEIDLRPHKDLWEKADERFIITQEVINKILR
ncbi:MAG: NYN domain protein [Pelotomaculum sp. PtaB.Bin104]|nr:MAG: NYN domain protein [Pelotomaculum sp. PtaB.Bin104]